MNSNESEQNDKFEQLLKELGTSEDEFLETSYHDGMRYIQELKNAGDYSLFSKEEIDDELERYKCYLEENSKNT